MSPLEPTVIDTEPMDPAKKNSRVAGPISDEATVQLSQANAQCYWNDTEYPAATRVSAEGICYECCFGQWVTLPNK